PARGDAEPAAPPDGPIPARPTAEAPAPTYPGSTTNEPISCGPADRGAATTEPISPRAAEAPRPAPPGPPVASAQPIVPTNEPISPRAAAAVPTNEPIAPAPTSAALPRPKFVPPDPDEPFEDELEYLGDGLREDLERWAEGS